jgi:GT2 family glycosyltransferase
MNHADVAGRSQLTGAPSETAKTVWSRCVAVVIGRNEADRLGGSLASVAQCAAVVYVDSASTDASVRIARASDSIVVELDSTVALSAARARNAGFEALRHVEVDASEFVLFVDGDCEVKPDFVAAAVAYFDQHPDVVGVTGWTREAFPDASIYNLLCDVEWRMGGVGEIGAFGGNVMLRRTAFDAVNGYASEVIAAEDDDLAIRLRQNGGRLWRLDTTCVLHDAAITDFGTYWRRALRCGHAYAQVSERWGATSEKKFVRETRSALIWGAAVPSVAVLAAVPTHGISLLSFGKYPVSGVRQFVVQRTRFGTKAAAAWAVSCEVSKFAQAIGILKYKLHNR